MGTLGVRGGENTHLPSTGDHNLKERPVTMALMLEYRIVEMADSWV